MGDLPDVIAFKEEVELSGRFVNKRLVLIRSKFDSKKEIEL